MASFQKRPWSDHDHWSFIQAWFLTMHLMKFVSLLHCFSLMFNLWQFSEFSNFYLFIDCLRRNHLLFIILTMSITYFLRGIQRTWSHLPIVIPSCLCHGGFKLNSNLIFNGIISKKDNDRTMIIGLSFKHDFFRWTQWTLYNFLIYFHWS